MQGAYTKIWGSMAHYVSQGSPSGVHQNGTAPSTELAQQEGQARSTSGFDVSDGAKCSEMAACIEW